MFMRQWTWLLAYGLSGGGNQRVKHIPALLNGANPLANGFWAEFVGSEEFGCLSFALFFPFQPQVPHAPVAGWANVTVGDLIPPERMGQLVDDVQQIWQKEVDEQKCDEAEVEITVVNGNLTKVRSMVFGRLGTNHAIFRGLNKV
jgi:hypothetical protein